MSAIAVVGWLGIIGALLVWQGLGLVRGPEWPTLSDFFRAFMALPPGRFLLFAASGGSIQRNRCAIAQLRMLAMTVSFGPRFNHRCDRCLATFLSRIRGRAILSRVVDQYDAVR